MGVGFMGAYNLYKNPSGERIASTSRTVYEIDHSLYLNLTNSCTNECYFCPRLHSNFYHGYNLRIQALPNGSELIHMVEFPRRYREIVFSGFGEPTLRLGVIKYVSQWVKDHQGRTRLVTNGHGNLIHKRNIVPELVGLIDTMSISLNADTPDNYIKFCRPQFGIETYSNVIEFIKQSIKYIPTVEITTVASPGINTQKCLELAIELGANFRLRELIPPRHKLNQN